MASKEGVDMQRVFSTAWRHLRSTAAQPGMIIVFVALPVLFSLFFGSLFSSGGGTSRYHVAIVASDDSVYTKDIVESLNSNANLSISWVTEEQARDMVSKRNVSSAFVLPKALVPGAPAEIVVYREDKSNMFIAVEQEIIKSVRRVVSAITVADVLGGGVEVYNRAAEVFEADSIRVDSVPIAKAETKTISNMAGVGLGMTIMFLMMSAVISTGAILEERQKGTWRRVLAAPVTRMQVLSGYLLGFLVVAFVQFVILAVIQHFLFKVDWGNLYLLVPFALLFLVCAMSLGLALAGLVRTFQQQSSVASLVMTASGMLSGIFWPIEVMPPLMQTLAKGMPQYWALQGFTNIMMRGDSFSGLLVPGGILLSMTVVFLSFGVARVRFE